MASTKIRRQPAATDSSVLGNQPPALNPALIAGFAGEVVRWQASHGRNSLPWQNTRDPYRVWLSEIMLQQTQVVTVLDYYARFLQRFPAVSDLAAASQDEVLGLWSGLGYYSRARNLHRCAQDVMALHAGRFPTTAQQLQTLPGIGPSTAAAIASFCFSERVAILDGNVKRVLTRVLGFSGDLAQSANERALWAHATALLPKQDLPQTMPRYTQGLMDLGATVCTGRQPQCLLCPVQTLCGAFAAGEPDKYPVKTRKLKRSAQALSLLWAQKPDGSVWLEKRSSTGIWGGLYCLPVFDSDDELKALLPPNLQNRFEPLPQVVHVLTHKDLYLSPWIAGFGEGQAMPQAMVSEARPGAWFSPTAWPDLGLPAPIRKLLAQDGQT
ncbi:A/G-specific DNA-adenine glycosylase [Polaromonas sp. OV174]|uniref:A/G-specific adenine glycosylase n=1 Tax=Polaromonas sp. OV174 TaxID=1855300 RepID=UPI0008E0C468|nr:A/G-specific adenine glycosylase [Polaromonas sp. OV174]SFC51831.1 A/G-specific DNA-adenine glycosylase [Polaromonas sp. OV174]